MSTVWRAFLALMALAWMAPLPALAATVTGQVTYIGPDGDTLILNRRDVYAVSPKVSLADVAVRQTITAEVSSASGTRTIVKLQGPPAKH
jgi:hypothetical protein